MSNQESENFVPTPPASTDNSHPHGHAQQATPVQAAPGTSGLAVAGFVLAIIGVFVWALFPLLGLILSIFGLKDAKKNHKGGSGLAIAGIILGALGLIASLIWILVFVFAIVAAPKSSDYNFNNNSSSYSSQETVTKSGSVGEAIEAEDMQLTVTEVKRGYVPSSQFYTPDEGMEYVAVSVNLKNVGSKTESFSSFDFKMRDASGAEKGDSFVGSVDGELSSGSLAPNGTAGGIIVFEVPTGDANLVLIYEPSIFADEKAEIQL